MTRLLPIGIICALLAACLYGTVPVSTRLGITHGMAAIEIISFRTLVAGLVLTGLAVLRSERFTIPRHVWPAFSLQCLATLGVSLTYLMSLQFIPVGLSVIIFFTFPVIIALVTPIVDGHSPNRFKTLMSVIALVGLIVAIGPEFGGANLIGITLAATAAMSCALQFISGRRLGEHVTPAAFGGMTHLIILPLVVATANWLGYDPFAFLSTQRDSAMALLGMATVALGYLGGYFLHMTSLSFSRPATVAPYFNIEPVVSTILAIFILGERLSLNQYVGGTIVLTAILLTSTIGERKEAQA